MDERLALMGVPVVFTSRKAKRPAMAHHPVHVWIDDNPEAVHMDATQIWDTQAPEGCPVVPVHA